MDSDNATSSSFTEPSYIVDAKTLRHNRLSAKYKQSYAYKTMRFRLPAILLNVIEDIKKDTENIVEDYGEPVRKDISEIISSILELKNEIENDGELKTFEGNEGEDKRLWNYFIKDLESDYNTFFKTCWLYAECYVYRRLYSFFENHPTIKDYDYFANHKMNAFVTSTEPMVQILDKLEAMKADFSDDNIKLLLKLNLWGNRCDLSHSSGKAVKVGGNPFEVVKELDSKIIADQCDEIIKCLRSADQQNTVIVDFVCDNAGYELFTDLVLAYYLIESKLVSKVRFHLKAMPWFISDATRFDILWSMGHMREHSSFTMRKYGTIWKNFFKENKFLLFETEYFWTTPCEYYTMAKYKRNLYRQLAKAHLIIFKGDLNYRKLLADINWDYSRPLFKCLRGFQPAHICSLRTTKADLICGLAKGKSLVLDKESADWMTSGEYGVIQFSDMCICNTLCGP